MPLSVQVGDEFVPIQWLSESVENVQAGPGAGGTGLAREAEEKLIALEKDAYKKGFQQGRTEAFKEERERIEAALEGLAKVTRELSHMKRNVLEDAEKEILELALDIGRKAVLQEISVNRELVMNAVKTAVKKVAHNEDLKIRVNPKDIAMVEEHRPELLRLNEGEGQVAFVKDERVAPGGCIVETDHQVVEYHPHLQIEAISKALRKKTQEKKDEPLS